MASAKKFLFDTDFRGNGRKAVDEGALDAARAEGFHSGLDQARREAGEQSVVVDVFDGYDANDAPLWHRVNIVAGSYEKTTKHYQDFIFSIEEPALSAQML